VGDNIADSAGTDDEDFIHEWGQAGSSENPAPLARRKSFSRNSSHFRTDTQLSRLACVRRCGVIPANPAADLNLPPQGKPRNMPDSTGFSCSAARPRNAGFLEEISRHIRLLPDFR
jgi:hypothetical protein